MTAPFSESVVEDAALSWRGALAPKLISGELWAVDAKRFVQETTL